MAVRDVVAAPRTSFAAALFIGLALIAFWPAYLSKLPGGDELFVDLHLLGVVAWFVLLLVQPLLIFTRRRPLHRKLGLVAYGLVPYIVITSVMLAHSRLDPVSAPTFRADATDNYLAQIAIVLFALCAGLGLAYRRNAALHARFMTATLLTAIDPISFRLLFFYAPAAVKPPMTLMPLVGYAITDLILLALVIADRKRPQGGRAFPLLLPIFVIGHAGYFTVARSDGWIRLMAAFKALPLG